MSSEREREKIVAEWVHETAELAADRGAASRMRSDAAARAIVRALAPSETQGAEERKTWRTRGYRCENCGAGLLAHEQQMYCPGRAPVESEGLEEALALMFFFAAQFDGEDWQAGRDAWERQQRDAPSNRTAAVAVEQARALARDAVHLLRAAPPHAEGERRERDFEEQWGFMRDHILNSHGPLEVNDVLGIIDSYHPDAVYERATPTEGAPDE